MLRLMKLRHSLIDYFLKKQCFEDSDYMRFVLTIFPGTDRGEILYRRAYFIF